MDSGLSYFVGSTHSSTDALCSIFNAVYFFSTTILFCKYNRYRNCDRHYDIFLDFWERYHTLNQSKGACSVPGISLATG